MRAAVCVCTGQSRRVLCGFMPQLHTIKFQFPKDRTRRQFYPVIKRVRRRCVVHSVFSTVLWADSEMKQRSPPCLISSQDSCPIEHAKHALWCLGALWVVAKAPQVLLDVGGDIHHVRPHAGLHLPVWELHALLVQHHRHGQREVSPATHPRSRDGSLAVRSHLTFHFCRLYFQMRAIFFYHCS